MKPIVTDNKKNQLRVLCMALIMLLSMNSVQLLSQTAPDDTSTTNDRGVMAVCAATAVATPSAVCTGNTSVISLSGATFGIDTYQWSSNVNGGGWNVIPGATSSTYTTPVLTSGNTYQYRCAISDAPSSFWCTAGTSTSVSITPSAAATVSAAGTDQNICVTTATLNGNNPVTGTGVWSLISGSGTITTPSSPTSGLTALGVGTNTFRWTITNGGCSSSDDVIITNGDASSVSVYASANCPTSTTSAVLSVFPQSSTFTSIQWQESDNGGAYADIVGATTAPYTATKVAGHTYTYKAIITTACGTYSPITSDAVTPYGFFDYTGGNNNYTTADAASDCYYNLVAGQKYCFAFVYSHYIEMDWEPNGCAGCPNIYMKLVSGSTSTSVSTNGCSSTTASATGNCATAAATCASGCVPVMYNSSCGVVKSDGFQFGSGCASPAMTEGEVYYICFTVPATCGGMSMCPQINCSAGNCSASPLPIELLYFTAEPVGGQVQLKWATATETNNDYFIVEHSSDGKSFAIVGSVDGAGNSSSILNYNTTDENPLKGISYYRLKQMDYDGKFAFSRIVSVQMAADSPLKLMYVSPDQTKNSLFYQFSYTQNKLLMIEVMDIVGKTIYSQKVSSDENGQPLNMDATGLSKGIYFMKISDGIYSEVKKFIY